MPADSNKELLQQQQEITRLLRALHTLAEKQLSVSLENREELLSKKQLILDELTRRDLSSIIKKALEINETKNKEEAEKQIEYLHAIEQLEATTLDRWYKECEESLKNMQENSSIQHVKSQYKDKNKAQESRFLDDKR